MGLSGEVVSLMDEKIKDVGQKSEVLLVGKLDGEERMRVRGGAALFAFDSDDGIHAGSCGKVSADGIVDMLHACVKETFNVVEAVCGNVGLMLLAIRMTSWARQGLEQVAREGMADAHKEPAASEQ